MTIHHSRIKVVGVIPARWGSTRFPGKPLVKIKGKPMIQHVYQRAMKSKLIGKVIVATDDKRIYDAVKKFKGNVVMTSPKHQSGTDRIAEAVKDINCRIVVNIQGDEPFINPKNIDAAIKAIKGDGSVYVSTLCVKIKNKKEINDPNVVKVTIDKRGFALYFSRSPIPHSRSRKIKAVYYKHIGLYVYVKHYLKRFIELGESNLEKIEKLEQMRIIENRGVIKVVEVKDDSISIDTPKDLRRIKKHK